MCFPGRFISLSGDYGRRARHLGEGERVARKLTDLLGI